MRPLDFATIGRMQDITPIKQAEDMKPMVEQQSMVMTENKVAQHKQEQVNHHKDEDMDPEYDAKKGGNKGAFNENSGKKKKKQEKPDGIVTIKQKASFDIKI